jgi:hypothetical protein
MDNTEFQALIWPEKIKEVLRRGGKPVSYSVDIGSVWHPWIQKLGTTDYSDVYAIRFENDRVWDKITGWRHMTPNGWRLMLAEDWAKQMDPKSFIPEVKTEIPKTYPTHVVIDNPGYAKYLAENPLPKPTPTITTASPLKYHEAELLSELTTYINGTYDQHYIGNDNIQSLDLIFATGRGEGFCTGNILKLGARYGKKDGFNRKDLLKIAHYALLNMYLLDKEQNK